MAMGSKDSDNLYTSLSQDMFEDEEENKQKDRVASKPTKPVKPASGKAVSKMILPAVAVAEKILLVIDNTADESEDYLKNDPEPDTEPSVTAESIHKAALKQFVSLKLNQFAAKGTEIAVVALEPSKIVWQGLTSDKQRLIKELANIGPSVSSNGEQINITSIFNLVSNVVKMPEPTAEKNIPPEYIVRVVLVYCNSYNSPVVNTEDASFLKFSKSPFCVLDVLYLHEKMSNNNNVEQIFNQLSKFTSPISYLLESSRSVTNVYNQMAKLLAHPSQRAPQIMWNF